jgi:glycosyltransferase involved in cell wall biosynthesis
VVNETERDGVAVAIAHDYLTQRGGAERVVLAMSRAFPKAPIVTSLYNPVTTFPEFRNSLIRTTALNRIAPLRRHHRVALPLLGPVVGRVRVNASVVLCSSSGWAHGVRLDGARKIVFCHAPARWLYQTHRYSSDNPFYRAAIACMRPYLERWDKAAARSAHRYITTSTAMQQAIRQVYGIDAQVLPAPWTIDVNAERRRVPGIPSGFFLVVSRLLPYKNIRRIVEACRTRPELSLAIAGTGPQLDELRRIAPPNVHVLGSVTEAELRWLYSECTALVSSAYEDYGLTPLEAAAFGKPTVALRFGGFLDTVDEGVTGLFFGQPDHRAVGAAMEHAASRAWDAGAITAHADRFSEEVFITRLRELVEAELRGAEVSLGPPAFTPLIAADA